MIHTVKKGLSEVGMGWVQYPITVFVFVFLFAFSLVFVFVFLRISLNEVGMGWVQHPLPGTIPQSFMSCKWGAGGNRIF